MPNLFVVTDQRTLADLSGGVLRPGTSAGVRKAALEAIRRANPTLDLDHLRPGTVVVIPPVEGARADDEDPINEAVADLVERVRDGIASLWTAAEDTASVRETEMREARELFASEFVRRAAESSPEVKANVASVRATLKHDEVEANRAIGELRQSVDGWTAELDALRGLLPR